MKITVVNMGLSEATAKYAEVRAWLATQRFRDRVSWLTISLRKAGPGLAVCRMEAWISEVGLVAGEHEGADAAACVEVAAARLKHSAARRLKARWQAPRRWKLRGGGLRGSAAQVLAGAGS